MPGIRAMLSRRALTLLVVTVLGVLGLSGVANATSFTVNDTKDAALANPNDTNCVSTDPGPNNCTLRGAVQAADNTGGSSTITLPAGDYKLTISPSGSSGDPATGDLDVNNNDNSTAITINGAGSNSTTIDGTGIDRVFAVLQSITVGGLTLSGVTIEGGTASTGESTCSTCGGAIWSDGALNVSGDVVLKGNSASGNACVANSGDGGAIFAGPDTGSTLTVSGATFSNNSSNTDGGAIYDHAPGVATIANSTFDGNFNPSQGCDSGGAINGPSGAGGLTIDSSAFTSNSSSDGGAIFWRAASPVQVTNTTFTNNVANQNGCCVNSVGGAIRDEGSTKMTLTSDRFAGNSAGAGGALYLDSTEYVLTGDEFDGNTAVFDGGAIFWFNGDLTVDGSSFIHNNAGRQGGVLGEDYPSGALTLVNDTMSENGASQGGALAFANLDTSSPFTLTNDTIAYNTASSGNGGGVYFPEGFSTGDVRNTVIGSNTGGDCGDGSPASFNSSVDGGNNMDSDKSCFQGDGSPLHAGDQPGVNPMLGHPADNGGPVLTDSDLGSPVINAGTNTGCPATDARGVTRPQGASCDIGAYEATPANLSVTKSAPASVGVGAPFEYTVTVSNGGPASSTGTSLVDGLPTGETLWSVTPSQGTCSTSGGQVTCNLGKIDKGGSATVTMVVSEANAGSVTNTATVANDEGSSVSGSATTGVTAPGSNTITIPPIAVTGSLVLINTSLSVSNGKVSVKFMCNSNVTCIGTFTIEKRVRIAHTSAFGPLVCTKPLTTAYRIPAGATQTIKASVTPGCLNLLNNAPNQKITGKLSSGPRSGQAGVIKKVTMHNA
jgi:uncharacterized repeat protein (TIGR01451 family)